MEIYFVLDASAFINGFGLESNNNYTAPEITHEVKDFEATVIPHIFIPRILITLQNMRKQLIPQSL